MNERLEWERRRILEEVRPQLASVADRIETATPEEARRIVYGIVRDTIGFMRGHAYDWEVSDVADAIIREFFGYGVLQPFLDDDDVTEIMVNGCEKVYVEVAGVIKPVYERIFSDDDQVRALIDRIGAPLGKHCDAQSPIMDARLSDGSRVNASIPPVSRFGPCLTIRKFPKKRLDADALVEMGSCPESVMRFLACAVEARCNILVSGGTGSGKTTFLNVLCGFIPANERVITIEDTAELQLTVDNWLSMEARTANADGTGEITIHDLVVDSLRKRPDRIIVGECRSSETVEMLQAMNTGHDGSLTTIHANDPRSAFLRIETMVQATEYLTEENIDRQIASAIQLVVQLRRYRDGSRKVSEVLALSGAMEGPRIVSVPLYRNGETTGAAVPIQILERIQMSGAFYDRAWLGKEQ